ncbi:MAG: NAD(P)H-dependent oxidoreductase subunit E [Gemmatimonadota bacterium]
MKTGERGSGGAGERTPLRGNPGFAGETGDFRDLDEAAIRGTAQTAGRPLEGGHPGGAGAYPYQLLEKNPDAPLFEGPYRERLEKIRSRYPDAQGALLPALNLAQEIRGHLSADSMAQVARTLGLSPTYVRGVATFYTMYNKQPVGDFLIQVCTNVACNLCGADDVMEAFLEATGSESVGIAQDGLFTVIEAECLGACGFPTAVQINDRYFENVSPDDVPRILERLRVERTAAGSGSGAERDGAHTGHAQTAGYAQRFPQDGGDDRIAVPEDPGAAGDVVGPESNPYPAAGGTAAKASRPRGGKSADEGRD